MGLTRIFWFDVGIAGARRGGESKLHLRQVEGGTERQISYNVEVGFCKCIDAEGRPDREYPGEIKTRNANLEDLDGWSCQGALGVGGNSEGSVSVATKTTSESLLRFWSGCGGTVSYIECQRTSLSIFIGTTEPVTMNPTCAVTLALTSASILKFPETEPTRPGQSTV